MTTLNSLTRNRSLMIAGLAAVTLVLAAVSFCWAQEEILINIDVAPGVLNLQNKGQVVTIHTDLPYSEVTGASVALNDLPIAWWKMDNRGYFVAKFDIDEVKDIVVVGEYTLTLTGTTVNGGSFTGTAVIQVIDQSGK